MVSASDGWPKYWAAWGEWRPPWQVMRVRRVSPGCFRFAPPTLRRYDDVISNSPVSPAPLRYLRPPARSFVRQVQMAEDQPKRQALDDRDENPYATR